MTDRGQSEVVGFILVFSLVVASTGIVYAVGFSSLEDARTAEQLNNVERAFDILDDNMEDLSTRGAPTRSTEIDLTGGALRLGEPVTINVTATNTSNSLDNATTSTTSRPVVYEKDDRKVVYAYGAILRQNRDASVMVADPDWVAGDRRAIYPLLVIPPTGERGSVGGETTVLVRAQADSRGIESRTVDSSATTNVTVTVESPRAGAWKQFFEERGLEAVDGNASDGNVTYYQESDSVVIQTTTTSVEFDL